ncbi:hypothetical protein FVR03_11640 [Pontibacter qinzhouensis]|uniref:Uncharacterized protein n=1 Tax=Pontibacter qinzhouensis TaxID=2603253 RepID=A0A5C8K7T1_9BACT|nr:hypothetical protein [Pontibacter qinzhouensis]TXK45838.1 hypothetical protein FVR03_11640 [Pontibacter qinzhouensis]
MKYYLLLFACLTLLLFVIPKSSGMRSSAQQPELKQGCKYGKRLGKKVCAKKCLKHQTHSKQQNNDTGIASDCSQQVYAVVNEQHSEPFISFTANRDFILPHIRKYLSPVLEYDPEPPRLSLNTICTMEARA